MKEQDAAHSYSEGMDVPKKESIIQFLLGANSYDGYWWNDSPQVYGRAPFWWRKKLREEFESKESELTRLRSELQQAKHDNECLKDLLHKEQIKHGDKDYTVIKNDELDRLMSKLNQLTSGLELTGQQKNRILQRTSFKNVSGSWQFMGDMTPERFIKIVLDVIKI